MPDPQPLLPNQIINSEISYRQAIQIVIAEAQSTLKIFDQDLKQGGLNSIETSALLHRFIVQNPLSSLTIILHNTDFLEVQCTRLIQLIKVYGHRITIYKTNQAARHAKDCFIIGDDHHFIKRFHIDQARFKFNLNDQSQTTPLTARFQDLLEETECIFTLTTLGL